ERSWDGDGCLSRRADGGPSRRGGALLRARPLARVRRLVRAPVLRARGGAALARVLHLALGSPRGGLRGPGFLADLAAAGAGGEAAGGARVCRGLRGPPRAVSGPPRPAPFPL